VLGEHVVSFRGVERFGALGKLLTSLFLDGERVAVGILEPGDLAVIQYMDSFRVTLQRGFVIALEQHAGGIEFVDDLLAPAPDLYPGSVARDEQTTKRESCASRDRRRWRRRRWGARTLSTRNIDVAWRFTTPGMRECTPQRLRRTDHNPRIKRYSSLKGGVDDHD
jgi:hypothetical protein